MNESSRINADRLGRPRAPDRRLARTRAALIAAGEMLFSKQGRNAVNINDIVATADLTKASFYNHFADKEALVDEIMLQIRNRVGILIDEANSGISQPAERIARAICTVIRYSLDNRRSAAALMNLKASLPSLDEKLNLRAAEGISAGIADGSFNKVAYEEGLLLTIGSCAITIQHCLTKEIDAAAQLTSAMIAAVLRALGVTPGKAARIARRSTNQIVLQLTGK